MVLSSTLAVKRWWTSIGEMPNAIPIRSAYAQ